MDIKNRAILGSKRFFINTFKQKNVRNDIARNIKIAIAINVISINLIGNRLYNRWKWLKMEHIIVKMSIVT